MATNQPQPVPPPPRPLPQPQWPPQRGGRFGLAKLAGLILVSLMLLVGLAFLVIWLVVHPRRLVFTVDDAYIDHYNLTKDHLNATFDLSLRSFNPNRRIAVYYDDVQVTVEYDDQDLASSTAEPFFQGRKNETKLHVMPQAQDVALRRRVSRNLRIERSAGAVQLKVRLRAKVRYKVGIWKSRHRTLKVYCAPVLDLFRRGRSFESSGCDVEIEGIAAGSEI